MAKIATIIISMIVILVGPGIFFALLGHYRAKKIARERQKERQKDLEDFKKRWKDLGEKIVKDHPEIKHFGITFALETDTKRLLVILVDNDGAWWPIETINLTDEEVPIIQNALIERNLQITLEKSEDKYFH